VKTALLADADVKGTDISVETNKGEVMLSGFVGNQAQIDKAVQLASAVEGVKNVNNKMTVKQ
jgi:hyperosmotically inducible protein